MASLVWKRLRPEDLEAFRAYLAALPTAGGPRYGLLGVKASWWTRLGGGARPFVVLLVGGGLPCPSDPSGATVTSPATGTRWVT